MSNSVTKKARTVLLNQHPVVIWFTGLSGSGKTTLATAVETELHKRRIKTFLLDGDILRSGLNSDLGFSDADRSENIRRTGELCRLFNEAGIVVLASFISPFRKDRKMVRDLFPEKEFVEVFVNTPLELCMKRDPKGLYRRAKNGEVVSMTGIESAYESPQSPEIEVLTEDLSVEQSVELILQKTLPLILP